jgi:hypothetical protein
MKAFCTTKKGFRAFTCIVIKLIFIIIISLASVILWFYVSAPIYKFKKPQPFHGDKFYNPYADINADNWQRGNFQVQSYVWLGLTNGRKNTSEAISNLYHRMGYNVIVTSDYMSINKYNEGSPDYIPTYEHGYGLHKTHQVCIGSKRVIWYDIPFFPTLSHKQEIINRLRPDNEIIAIAHPDLLDGHTVRDMKFLSGYDLIEVLNNARFSIQHWDSALSNGHAVYILGNDDAHDITNAKEVGRACTYINAPTNHKDDILKSLKNGKAYGADITVMNNETIDKKIANASKIPRLESLLIKHDSLIVIVSDTAAEIGFYGQNGILHDLIRNQKEATYVLKTSDTYIRTEIRFSDKTTFYLNPVFRYSGEAPVKQNLAEIDTRSTFVFRIIVLVCLVFLVIVFFYLKKKRKQ